MDGFTATIGTILSVGDLEKAASVKLTTIAREFYKSGATNQITVHENSSAFTKYCILPWVLRDVSQVDMQTAVFDRDISFPCCVSPAGLQGLAHPEAELATSRACARMNINMGISSFANHLIEQITTAGRQIGLIHHVMQLYSMQDRAKQERIIRRAEEAGCKAIFLTGDSPVLGVRYNEWRGEGFRIPPDLGYPIIERTPEQVQMQSHDDGFESKGVLAPEDVETAIKYGCDGVIISNHGGRQLDDTPATIDALPARVKAARGRIRIHIDGGIRSGSDIFKALALGAECCWVGRPMLWGLAYDGDRGVELMLNILYQEFKRCMQLAGCKSISEITPSRLGIARTDGPLARP